MLRRNIDVTVGLVNGAIGTVMGIYSTRISIKFDHIDVPCDIERVTTRFMLSKNLYIHRKQFPLILSYAITIHKCQGLSLDTAIIDLSTDVFGDGMAYVALSRVRTLILFYTKFWASILQMYSSKYVTWSDKIDLKTKNSKNDIIISINCSYDSLSIGACCASMRFTCLEL